MIYKCLLSLLFIMLCWLCCQSIFPHQPFYYILYLGAYLLHPRLHLNLHHRFQLWICFSLHIFSNYLFSGKFISDNTLAIVAVYREDVGTFYGPAPSLFKIACRTITLFYSSNSIQGMFTTTNIRAMF
jgi:hypothetical protein